MKRLLPLCAAAALLLAACAGAPPAAPPAGTGAVAPPPAVGTPALTPGAAPFEGLAARFTDRALKAEKAGDLRRALESWRIVAGLRPQAAEPARRVADLGARAEAEAARHYADGLAKLKEGATDAARRSFLLALAANPDHADALDALKNRFEPDAVQHTVAPGETFESIAKGRYGDTAKAAIVARINDLDPAAKPAPGTVLTLPSLTPPAPKASAKRNEPAEQQDAAYDTEPTAVTPDAAAPPPVEPAAPPPAATVAPPPPAVAAPKPPDPAELERKRKEKAEELYNAGVRFFVDQKLDEAIQSWEQTLALNPQHPKAPKDIEKARALQQKLRDLK